MNKIKNQFSLRNVIGGLAILVLLSVGCGDKKDDENIGGAPTGGTDLANTTISAENGGTVFGRVNATISSAIGAVFQNAASKPVAPPLAKAVDLTVNGSSSGNVKAVGNFDATSTALSMDIKMTFTNYSDDNKLFLGGPLDITYNVDVANPAALTFTYKGMLAFSGDFKGSMEFDLSISGGTVSGFYKAGGVTITL